MARKPMVTRTFVTTKATVKAYDLNNSEVVELTVLLPKKLTGEALVKALKSKCENMNHTFLKTIGEENEEQLYGMSEEDFLANAVKLDNETRKVLETEEAEEIEL